MSRLPLLLGCLTTQAGYMLASRNKTERKDNLIRYGMSDAVFFGGDLLLASLISNASDKILKTKLTNNKSGGKSLFRKIFPKVKSVKQVMEETEKGIIKPKNKVIASSIFWTNLTLISVSIGFLIPALVNRMIKSDVQKDVKKDGEVKTPPPSNKYSIEDFLVSAVKFSKKS